MLEDKKMRTGYVSPMIETVMLLTSQHLLEGSPQGGLQDMLVNGIIDEGGF